ncbi:o-succinylbenzoate synthase [Pedococcus sp. 5OH_020]|uniref:o-succinylbenzoate synthase n=1 Tax=Pedococcus sp. 5OH_020 TaxID=2989814 RepID=UPI0022EA0FDD|nr:o-succinylbenzoate synthase [Pedococcus sp. 5OH_020]
MATIPDLGDLLDSMHVVSIPMRVRFRGVDRREAVLLEGPAGWGEFSPFLEYGPGEASRWLAAAVEAAWTGWPAPLRSRVPVNATVPAIGPERVREVLARFEGAVTAKVKVAEPGQSLSDDLNRVAAVRDVLGPQGRIRVDANGAWSVREASDALSRLASYGLEYAEQPCAAVGDLRELRLRLARAGLDVLVAADESIRKAEDPLRVAREEAADIVVVKVAPLGGVRHASQLVAACGLPAVVSSALDTSVGIAAGVALAAALPELPYACGLGTVALLEGDVARQSLVPRAGEVPTIRVAADPQLLARWAVTADRLAWWRRRVTECHPLLSGNTVDP